MKKGILYAFGAALCFGIMPILTKLVYQTGVDPFFLLMLRYSMAVILLWSYLILRKDRNWKSIDGPNFRLILATGLCYIMVTSTYFIALRYIDASFNSLLTFTFPVITPFIGRIFFKQELHRIQIIAAFVGFVGCGLLIGNYHFKGTNLEILGIGLGVASGIIYALYPLFAQKVTARVDPLTITAVNLSIVALFFLCLRFTWLWKQPPSLRIYLVAGILAVISTILANVFFFKAIRIVGAVKAGIFESMEPLFTTILAVIFLDEHFKLLQWAGTFFILAGIVIVQQPWAQGRQLQPDDKH